MVEKAAPVLMSGPNRGELPPKGEEEESRRRDDAALATDPRASESNPTGESPPKGELALPTQVNFEADFGGDEGPVLKVGEQGLKKKLLKEGEGWETPEVSDEVEVHYTGTLLDGTKFDSSRDRGDPFKFKLGQGQVIQGFSQGVKTIKKGENAIFTIAPELAYGASGSPPTVPANASLKFDVELLSCTGIKDVCKDGGIFKKILKKGDKWETLKDSDLQLCLVLAEVEGQRPSIFHLTNPLQQSLSETILCQPLLQSDTDSMVVKLKLIKGGVLIESVDLERSVYGHGQESMFNISVLINLEKQQVVLSFFNAGNWRSTTIYSMVPLLQSKPIEHSDDSIMCYTGIATSFYPLLVDFKKDFVLTEQIGEGAYGSVYKCSKHGVNFAIKKMHNACTVSKTPCSEVESMIRLAGCKNVVQIYSSWIEESSGQSFVHIAMELFERTLDDYLEERTELDLSKNRNIFREIMLGVTSMHQAGIIHRDLKPTNILLDNDLHAAIADFGMGKVIPEGTSTVRFFGSETYGTQYYTDPDLICGLYNEKVDIYSAGIIYLEMNFFTQRRKHIREFDSKYKQSMKNKRFDQWSRKSKRFDLWNSSMWANWKGDKKMMEDMVSRPRPDSSYFLEKLQAEDEEEGSKGDE